MQPIMYHGHVKKRTYLNKTRRVTACAECYRRKQKCNRQIPCNICTERGVPSSCLYGAPPSDSQLVPRTNSTSELPKERGPDNVALELSVQIGYLHNTSETGPLNLLDDFPADVTTGRATTRSVTASLSIPPRNLRKLNKLITKLPSPTASQSLLQVFFSEANWYFTVLDQVYFDIAHRTWTRSWNYNADATEQQVSLESLCFPALLFQVLAIGLQFVPPDSLADRAARSINKQSLDELSQSYSDTGEKILNMLGRHMQAISAVQADLMRCAWLKNYGRGAEAWYSLSNAIRQAQDQKLHSEVNSTPLAGPAEGLQDLWQREHKRRLWACLFTWEGHMALQLGRPRMINAEDCTVQAPIDSDIPEHPSRTLFSPAALDERPSHYTSAVVKYALARKIHKLMSCGAFQPDFHDYAMIQTVQAEVSQLLNDLPATVRPELPDTSWDLQCPEIMRHRLQISIITSSFLLSLHRPHIARHPESLALAISAAIKVLDVSQILFESIEPHQHKTYTLVFYTIDAGLLLSAMIAKDSHPAQDLREHAVSALQQAVIRLSVYKKRHLAASAGERALTKCLEMLGVVSESLQVEDPLAGQSDPGLRPKPAFETHSSVDESPIHPFSSAATTLVFPNDTQQSPLLQLHDQYTTDNQDIFTEIMNDQAFTASWLEQTNDLSAMDFGSDLGKFEWDSTFG